LSAQEGVEPDWLGVPKFLGGHGRQATERAVAAAGLDLESVEEVPEDEGDGRVVSFLWVTAARRPY
jgi:hypothetical protein